MLLSAMRQHDRGTGTKSSQLFARDLRLFLATSGSFTAPRMSAAARADGKWGVNEG
jgi:hypothetical protein